MFNTKKTVVSPALKFAFPLQVGLAFLIFILIGANDGANGVLIPSMGKHYMINKSTISLTFICSTIGYLLASFNSGFLVGKLGIRRFLLLGILLFLVSSIFLSLLPVFPIFAFLLLPMGFGISILDTGLNLLVVSQRNTTALLNYLHAFYGIGAFLGPLLASSFLAANLPWNGVYVVWVIVSCLVLLGIGLIFKPQPIKVKQEAAPLEKNILASIVKQRLIWAFAFFLFFYVGGEIILGTWTYSFLTEERHIFTLYAGWMVSGYWLGLTVGRVILGLVAQRAGEKRLIQFCVLGVIIALLLLWFVPVDVVAAFSLFFAGFCLGPLFPTAIAMVSKLIPGSRLATVIGFMVSLGCVGGAFLPWMAGNLAQFFGLWSILPYAILLATSLMITWLILQFWVQKEHPVA